MAERARKRVLPWLLTFVLAALLAITGASILTTEYVQTAAAVAKSASDEGLDEDVDTSATYDFSSVTTSNSKGQKYVDLAYTGSYHTVTLRKGSQYTFQLWGAQGAAGKGTGGKGGYATATSNILANDVTVYVYVGGQGTTTTYGSANGGYNGGGKGYGYTSVSGSAGGGGATDVRYTSGTWNDSASLLSRILVAGGGGGGGGTRYGLLTGGYGGGTTAGGGAWHGGTNNSTGCSFGGTQTGVGATPSGNGNAITSTQYPAFGVGGESSTHNNASDLWQGGGGGGWYGGWGGVAGASGGGGSGYAVSSSSNKPSGYTGYQSAKIGYFASSSLSGGNTAVPVTTINSTSTETGHSGHGFARIIQLNAIPAQRSAVSCTLGRNVITTVNVRENVTTGTNGISLNGYDADYASKGELVTYNLNNVYLSASTSSPATDWLTWSFNATSNATYFTLKAKKYWSGPKTFYVQVKDITSAGANVGGTAWFSFTATCDAASITANTKTSTATVNGVKYRFGTGANTIGNATATTGIYNPLGARTTLFLADPLSTNTAQKISATTLYTLANNGKALASDDKLMFVTSSVSYGTTRYHKDTGASQTISSAVAATNSEYFTQLSWEGTVSAGTTTGASTLVLQGKTNPAGPYYYTTTVTLQQICGTSGTMIAGRSYTFDVVYRVDNTRPKISTPPAHVKLTAGTSKTLNMSDICYDEDNNALTIVDVKVPEGEYVGVDQYGNVQTAAQYNYYNYGVTGATYDAAKLTGENTTAKTGFSAQYVYQVTGAPNSQALSITQSQGNGVNAYAGYYVNSAASGAAAATQLTIVGNKATRDLYVNRTGKNANNTLGHFYILVNIRDSGDISDLGVWIPVAITVDSAAPTAALTAGAYPSIDAAVGSSYIFSPLGGMKDANGTVQAIGSTSASSVSGWDSNIKLLATDRDIYSYAGSTGTTYTLTPRGGAQQTFSIPQGTANAPSAWQRETVFLKTHTVSTDRFYSERNAKLFSPLPSSNTHADRGIDDGFKEFFDVETVTLYAPMSILGGLGQSAAQELITAGVITITPGNDYFAFEGLKITPKKFTMGKYINFYVDVTDSFGQTSAIRVAVNVQNTLSTQRDNRMSPYNFNTRNGRAYRVDGVSSTAVVYLMKVNEDIHISPYELYYDPDTYTVNSGVEGQNAVYNTDPDAEGFADMLAGTDKNIAVYVSDSASSDVAQDNAFHMERLQVNANNLVPSVSGGGVYGSVGYDPATQSFAVHTTGKTPKNGYISFNFAVYSTGDSKTNSVEVRIIVENSLPTMRPESNKVFYLSADANLKNSSSVEAAPNAPYNVTSNGYRYYAIDDNTYNVREFKLDDLFEDKDGDVVRYGVDNRITVGTKLPSGEFVPLTDEQNIFVRAYIGAGSNERAGTSDCLIIEGLSSTQGVPGGIWVRFDVTDNAVDTTSLDFITYMFQVEVINTAPTYADMTDASNTMEDVRQGEDDDPQYVWTAESAQTSNIIANAFEGAGDKQNVYAPNADEPATSVEKPLYLISDDKVMPWYAAALQDTIGASLSYSAQQLRRIAQDADNGQGLSLFGGEYDATSSAAVYAPDVKIVRGVDFTGATFSRTSYNDADIANKRFQSYNPAVIVNDFYNVDSGVGVGDVTGNPIYYKNNNTVQVLFFDDEGKRIVSGSESTVYKVGSETTNNANLAANKTTHWLVAFHFTATLSTDVQVRIRLRDSNNMLYTATLTDNTDPDSPQIVGTTDLTAGGYSFGSTGNPTAYRGVRHLNTTGTAFRPETAVIDSAGTFSFTIHKQRQGLYNNFTKWTNAATTTITGANGDEEVDLMNVWAFQNEDLTKYPNKDWYTYADATTGSSYLNQGVFRYSGITVPATENSSVGVPISYFAWPVAATEGTRYMSQREFAWYNISQFATSGEGINPNVARIDAVRGALSLTDGVSTWSGSELNNNPYITFDVIAEKNATESFGSNLPYHNTQRIRVTDRENSSQSGLEVVSMPLSVGDNYYLEDTFGLKLSKKNIRSVGTLYLTVQLALWTDDHVYSSTSAPQKDESNIISVTVPVTVENSPLQMQDTSQSASMSASDLSGVQVSLSTNINVDKPEGVVFGANVPPTGSPLDQVVSGATRPYAEDAYFLMSSLEGITADQLSYITSQYVMWGRNKATSRLREYLGIPADVTNTESALANLKVDGGKLYYNNNLVEVNKNYYNYFTVSPAGTDSKSITITPVRMTTFDYTSIQPQTGETMRAAIEREAAARGLKVRFTDGTSDTVGSIYYPLKLIVYDKLTVGYATKTTKFEESSFDVVTIEVTIGNSAPKAVTRNFAGKVTIGAQEYPGRALDLSKGGSAAFALTDLFEDRDMVLDPSTGSYYTQDKINTSSDALLKDTGDYLQSWEGTGDSRKVAKVELFDANGSAITDTTYDDVTVEQSLYSQYLTFTVTLNNIKGYTSGRTVAYVVLTFKDRFDTLDEGGNVSSRVSVALDVRMSNGAPTLSENAQRVSSITMRTGEYFTMYVTPYTSGSHNNVQWDGFISGDGTKTVGNVSTRNTSAILGQTEYRVGDGAYFAEVGGQNGIEHASGTTSTGSMTLNGTDVLPWSYYQGVNYGYNGNTDLFLPLPDVAIGQDGSTAWQQSILSTQTGTKHPAASSSAALAKNLGYMSLAYDDAPWTLRISKVEFDARVDGFNMITATQLNHTPYEGSTSNFGAMAVMFRAQGAISDVRVRITLMDGYKDSPYSLTYSFTINVVSTLPEAITDQKNHDKLGESLSAQDREKFNYVSYESSGEKPLNIYELKMKVGDRITLRTSDFATDADLNDAQNLYLLAQDTSVENGYFFMRNDDDYKSGSLVSTTKYVSLAAGGNVATGNNRTPHYTQFTVTARNFHNYATGDSAQINLYDVVRFYISDPYYSTVNDALYMELRIYVEPSDVVGNTQAKSIVLNGVQKALDPEVGPSDVRIVSKPGEDGLVTDNDAGAPLTSYRVHIYSYTEVDEDGTPKSVAMSSLPADRTEQLVASYDPTTQTTTTFTGKNAKAVQEFVNGISFSADGTVMTVLPKRATGSVTWIPGSSQSYGIGLYVEVEKVILFDNAGTDATVSANARINVAIENSAPTVVGDTSENFGRQLKNGSYVAGKEYLLAEGSRGDSWDYYLANPYTKNDEALFADPDGDEITAYDWSVESIYTINPDGATEEERKVRIGKEYTSVWASAAAAYAVTQPMRQYTAGATGEEQVYNLKALRLEILSKVDLSTYEAAARGRTVYLEIRIGVRDASSSSTAPLVYTTITLGISNSVPEFVATDVVNDRYNTLSNSYVKHDNGDAELSLVMNKDDSSKFLTRNGEIEVPIRHLVTDGDYNEDPSKNVEHFSFVAPAGGSANDNFAGISGKPDMTLCAGQGMQPVTSNRSDDINAASTQFTVRVSDTNNTSLIFKVQSYARGNFVQLRLVVADSSGATTGILTITLTIGNSAPVDLTATEGVSATIVLAGGKTGTGNNNTFPSIEYSIFTYVSDPNPEGKVTDISSITSPTRYLSIISYSAQAPSADSTFDDASGDSDGSGTGDSAGTGGVETGNSTMLVNFVVTDEQHFSVAPIAGRYGTQRFTLRIYDGGSLGSADDEFVDIEITVRVTKNPTDMDVQDFNVYFKQTKAITAAHLFDDPATDVDESAGFLIRNVTISADQLTKAEVVRAENSYDFSIVGLTRNSTVTATASVVVGSRVEDGLESWDINFTILVGDNKRPEFNYNHTGKKYGDGITYITKGMYDEDGYWRVSVYDLFVDNEQDVLRLRSASSKKSTLVAVTADTQSNDLVFQFKARGTSTVKVTVEDAVGPYSYSFDIGTNDRPAPNFFVGMIARVQGNPLIYIVIACAILLLLIILIIIIAAVRKKKRMREEIEALLVSEMELEEQMLKLAAGPSPTFYQAYGYLPPNGQQPNSNMMLGTGQSAPNPNEAIGLNPGNGAPNQGTQPNNTQAPPPPTDGFNDDDL